MLKMTILTFETLFLLLSLCVVCEAQIRCYTCSTQDDYYAERCGDYFRLTSVDAARCQGSCQKTRGYRDEGGRRVVEVTRSCVAYQDRDECFSGSHNGISADICICNEDMCNTATSTQHWTWGGLVLSTVCLSLKSYLL